MRQSPKSIAFPSLDCRRRKSSASDRPGEAKKKSKIYETTREIGPQVKLWPSDSPVNDSDRERESERVLEYRSTNLRAHPQSQIVTPHTMTSIAGQRCTIVPAHSPPSNMSNSTACERACFAVPFRDSVCAVCFTYDASRLNSAHELLLRSLPN